MGSGVDQLCTNEEVPGTEEEVLGECVERLLPSLWVIKIFIRDGFNRSMDILG